MLSKYQETPEIVVVICHHVGISLLERCLESVLLSECVSYEIIVVTSDNGFDYSFWLKKFHTINFWFEQGGPAHKRNWAVARTKSPYIVFLDDDVEISPYCIYELKKGLEQNQKCGMAFAKILNMERRNIFDDCGSWLTPTGFLWARAGNNQTDNGQFEERCRILASKSATCVVKSSCFRGVQGFDSSYFILGEETDLAWRMWLKGWEVWYNPKAVSWHAFGTSLKSKPTYYTLERIHFHGCKNYINLLCTNLGLARLMIVLPIHLSIWFVGAVGFLLNGEWRRSYQILRGILWNITHVGSTISKRRKVQASRALSDRQLLKVVSYNPPLSYYFNRLFRYLIQGIHG